jgi:hypothetical protein
MAKSKGGSYSLDETVKKVRKRNKKVKGIMDELSKPVPKGKKK